VSVGRRFDTASLEPGLAGSRREGRLTIPKKYLKGGDEAKGVKKNRWGRGSERKKTTKTYLVVSKVREDGAPGKKEKGRSI